MPSNHASPRPSRRGSVIIFDPETQTVSTTKLKRFDKNRIIKSQSTPKWASYVDIYIGEEETKRLAATLNLDKLGWATNVKRMCGGFSEIYVVECDKRTASSLVQAS